VRNRAPLGDHRLLSMLSLKTSPPRTLDKHGPVQGSGDIWNQHNLHCPTRHTLSKRVPGTHVTFRLVMQHWYALARANAAALAVSELPVCKLAYMDIVVYRSSRCRIKNVAVSTCRKDVVFCSRPTEPQGFGSQNTMIPSNL
jgi:hypothetical protein